MSRTIVEPEGRKTHLSPVRFERALSVGSQLRERHNGQRLLRKERWPHTAISCGLGPSAGLAALGPHHVGITTDDHERLHQPISRDGHCLSGVDRKASTEPLIAIARFRSNIATQRHAEDAGSAGVNVTCQDGVIVIEDFDLAEDEAQVIRQERDNAARKRDAVQGRRPG